MKLPNNGFGIAILLFAVALIVIVPFVLVYWGLSFFAPWWVSVPIALSASLIAFIKTVEFK